MSDVITAIIYEAVDEVNAMGDGQNPLVKSSNTVLLGGEGAVDSLALLNLVVAIERILEEKTGKTISIANEAAFELPQNPFSTIGTLIPYIDQLMNQPA